MPKISTPSSPTAASPPPFKIALKPVKDSKQPSDNPLSPPRGESPLSPTRGQSPVLRGAPRGRGGHPQGRGRPTVEVQFYDYEVLKSRTGLDSSVDHTALEVLLCC